MYVYICVFVYVYVSVFVCACVYVCVYIICIMLLLKPSNSFWLHLKPKFRGMSLITCELWQLPTQPVIGLRVCIPSKFICGNPHLQWDSIRRCVFGWWLGADKTMKVDPPWGDLCLHKKRKRLELTLFYHVRYKMMSASQEEGLHQEPNWSEPWSWTSKSSELWERDICV